MDILYTKEDCPMCHILKSKLDRAGLPYSEFTDEAKMLSMGIDALPVYQVGGMKLSYGEAVKYANTVIKENENE